MIASLRLTLASRLLPYADGYAPSRHRLVTSAFLVITGVGVDSDVMLSLGVVLAVLSLIGGGLLGTLVALRKELHQIREEMRQRA